MKEILNKMMDDVIGTIREESKSKEDFIENLKKAFPTANITEIEVKVSKQDSKDENENGKQVGEIEYVPDTIPFVKNILDNFKNSITPECEKYKDCMESLNKHVLNGQANKHLFLGKTIAVKDALLKELEDNLAEYEMTILTEKCLQDIIFDSNSKNAEKTE